MENELKKIIKEAIKEVIDEVTPIPVIEISTTSSNILIDGKKVNFQDKHH